MPIDRRYVLLKILDLSKYTSVFILAASLEHFESQKYRAVKIIEKIRLAISGKDQH